MTFQLLDWNVVLPEEEEATMYSVYARWGKMKARWGTEWVHKTPLDLLPPF